MFQKKSYTYFSITWCKQVVKNFTKNIHSAFVCFIFVNSRFNDSTKIETAIATSNTSRNAAFEIDSQLKKQQFPPEMQIFSNRIHIFTSRNLCKTDTSQAL